MNKLLITLIGVWCLAACTQVEDLVDDPNRATSVTPDLILTNLETKAFNNISTSAALASRQLTFTDGVNANQYYSWQRSSFGNYDNLKQAQRMVQEAQRSGQEVYQILGEFFTAYYMVELTQVFGDVPFEEALQAQSGKLTPTYDSQEQIYEEVLNKLKEASLALATNEETINGDLVFFGDRLKWRRLINSYSLRVLLSLSNKVGETSIDITGRFQEIMSNPSQFPIMESIDDDAALDFANIQGNRYPLFNSNDLQTAYYMEKSFVERLQDLEDPRLFAMADKKPNGQGAADGDFTAYGGLYGSAELSVNAAQAVSGEASRINARYYSNPTNESSFLMSFAELQFILAEAAARDWMAMDEKTFYEAGIVASMNFYGITEIADYLANPEVQLMEATAIEQILTQKHIAMFMNTGWQMFYEQRRTGFPEFNIDGGGVLNGGQIPKRWMYPESERVNNSENLEAAINRQFSGGDTVNGEMWLLK